MMIRKKKHLLEDYRYKKWLLKYLQCLQKCLKIFQSFFFVNYKCCALNIKTILILFDSLWVRMSSVILNKCLNHFLKISLCYEILQGQWFVNYIIILALQLFFMFKSAIKNYEIPLRKLNIKKTLWGVIKKNRTQENFLRKLQ